MGQATSKDEDDSITTSVGRGNSNHEKETNNCNDDNKHYRISTAVRIPRKQNLSELSPKNNSSKNGKTVLSNGDVADYSNNCDDKQTQIDMEYMENVAEEACNLPLTLRDDPELGRTVSTLTAEEYAFKSAAFIPCDIRVIGGLYLNYGKVWNLPTEKEICSANAQEPGRTNGGANCNAMLKALYDVKSHESDNVLEDNYMDPDNIFNDDDAASMSTYKPSFDVLSMGNSVLDLNTTWSSLLYKMKDEILGVGFSQVPIITSSRKLDLNQPFSLTNPKKFDRAKNKKLSLLIGCNYDNFSGSNLKACHDDIRSIKDYIVNVHNFSDDEKYMTILLDDDKHTPPTHKNIAKAFESLASKSQRGDAVFIQFSGHGGRVCSDKSTEEGYDEVLLSNDSSMKGLVQDTLIFKTLLIPMKEGVTVTMVIDCCNTGAILDLPYSWSTRDDSDMFPKISLNENFSFARFLKVVKNMYELSSSNEMDVDIIQSNYTIENDSESLATMDENDERSITSEPDQKFKDSLSKAMNRISSCSMQSPKDLIKGVFNCNLKNVNDQVDDGSICDSSFDDDSHIKNLNAEFERDEEITRRMQRKMKKNLKYYQ